MSENADLISEFGSKASTPKVVSPNADLINAFGGGNVQAVAPTPVMDAPIQSNIPQPMTDAEIAASQKDMPSNQFVRDIKHALPYIASKGMENYKSSKELATKGVNE